MNVLRKAAGLPDHRLVTKLRLKMNINDRLRNKHRIENIRETKEEINVGELNIKTCNMKNRKGSIRLEKCRRKRIW